MIKLACVLPVWKGDDVVAFQMAVDSLVNQELEDNIDLTVFFCLDGDLLESHLRIIEQSSRYLSTVCVNNKYSSGLAHNLNSGLEDVLSRNFDYIARMDADDICLNNRFVIQLKYLEKNLDVDLVGSWSFVMNGGSSVVGEKKVHEVVSFDSLALSCDVIHPTVVFRRNFFNKFGLYDGSYVKSQDWELWLRSLKRGAVIKNVQQSLLKLRVDNNLICRRKNEQRYNRKIIVQYFSGSSKYKRIARSWLIELLPSTILRFLLHREYKT